MRFLLEIVDMKSRLLLVVGLLAAAATSSPGLYGQGLPFDAEGSVRSRGELERLLALDEETLASPAYSSGVKREAERNAERIRFRLREGDFRVGDRVALYVEGEPQLPDTVPVESGPLISLPLFGQISLAGVLRSEIQEHLTREISQFIRDPVVRANGLMRLSILGLVGSPGFFVVPAELLVTEALMVAGGPAGDADLTSLRIERGSALLIGGQDLQEAMREGRTLDQLNLQAGDQIVLPERQGSGIWGTMGQTFLFAIPSTLILVLVTNRFR